MSKIKKWQRFESLVERIQSTLTPDAQMTRNEKFRGKDSETWREIDIVVRQRIGEFAILIAIDCKDYNRPVNLKDLEAFMGLVSEVGANKAAIVSAKGFSSTVLRKAKRVGIDLYTLIDAAEHEWQSYITLPVLCTISHIETFLFRVKTKEFRTTVKQFPGSVMVFRGNRSRRDTLLNLLYQKWNNAEIPHETGEHHSLPLVEDDAFVITKPGSLMCKAEIVVDVVVERNLYYGQQRADGFCGFRDEITGALRTRRPFSVMLDAREVRTQWIKVTSEDQLSVKPVFTLTGAVHYPRIELSNWREGLKHWKTI